jgi:hypothetical protein
MPKCTGSDVVAAHLRTAHTQLTRPSHWQRAQTRWADTCPGLSAFTPDDFGARFTNPEHPGHTSTCVALLRLHQAGDTDATTLLLTAAAPIIGTLATRDYHTDRFDHLWAATARLLATGDPDTYSAGRPFLVTFMGRLRRDAQRSRHAEERSRITTSFDAANDTRPSHVTPVFGPLQTTSVDDIIIARAELAAVLRHVRNTARGDRWHELVEHAIHTQPLPIAVRVRIHRLRRRLLDLRDAA